MIKGFFVLVIISINFYSANCQNAMTWFQSSSLEADNASEQPFDCMLIKDGKTDDNTGLRIHEYKEKPLFVYTHPQVRKYLNKEYLMEATAKLQKVDKNLFLIIDYKINSGQAKSNYGNLEKGSKIKVTLSNGDHIYLANIERDRGKVKRTANYTLYTGTHAITKDHYGRLKKHSLDKITVLWEEGVEEYEVQNIDLIKNQINCLND